MPLFNAAALSEFVQDDIDTATAARVEQVVWGWLQPILNDEDRRDQVSPQLFSWALELGAIAHENPTGLEAYQLGAERRQFSQDRRREILVDVKASVDGIVGTAPRGDFPEPLPCPDW
jgi:hypothetical protein